MASSLYGGAEVSNQFIGSYNFRVYIQGSFDPAEGIVRMSPLVANTESFEFRSGRDLTVRRGPGRVSFDDVTLEKVYKLTDDTWARWRDDMELGKIERKTLVIEFLDANGGILKTYHLTNAFPVRWETPGLDATSTEVGLEKVTFRVENIARIDTPTTSSALTSS